jgi:hypothetical protein
LNLENILTDRLKVFDSFDLDDESSRRVSLVPLYDLYLIILAYVGVRLCELNRAKFSGPLLTERWTEVKKCLEKVGNIPQRYDDEIKNFHKIRNKTQHDEIYIPEKSRLLDFRKMWSEFLEWIIDIGNFHYKEVIMNMTFTQRFIELSKSYIGRSDYVFDVYGDEPPFLTRSDVLFEDAYQELGECRNVLDSRLRKLHSANDITKEDFDSLIMLVTHIERIDAKEYVYLEREICPKCGGKISETQSIFGGSDEDPEPTSIRYRVGCEQCDFELHSETIDV